MSARGYSLTSPRVVFPALGLVLLLAALLQPAEQRADSRLSSYSAAPNGGKALYDIAARLGWQPVRRTARFISRLDSAQTYLVLGPIRAVTPAETHLLLDAVRRGAGLMVVVSEDDAMTESLTDSLDLSLFSFGYHLLDGGPAEQAVSDARSPGQAGGARPFAACSAAGGTGADYVRRVFTAQGKLPIDTTVLLRAKLGERPTAVALARPFGRGRVVAVSDPDLLRNDVLRLCGSIQARQRPGLRAVRLLEAVAPAGGTLVFDEWHQGYGNQPVQADAISYALGRTGWGRAVGVAIIAALLALWAAGARALVPVDRTGVERRSPLEHVGALARAYEQVGATRTAVRRMVRGLRRRHPSAARRGSDDAAFLDAFAERRPELAPAVALVRHGTDHQLGPAELVAVASAIEAIDNALARPAGAAAGRAASS